MSRLTVVAKRYARALFEVAQQQNAVSDVESQLKALVDAIGADQQIGKFLELPNIDASKKTAIVKQAVEGKVSAAVLNTVELLLNRGRQDLLADVYAAYTKVAGEALGQAHATVYTAKPLSAEELGNVASRFEAITGKKIVAEQVTDPSLLGGVQVRIGDRLYDGSLSGKLARLEQNLKSQAL